MVAARTFEVEPREPAAGDGAPHLGRSGAGKRWVLVVGPDGVGKTTVADAIARLVADAGGVVVRVHHRRPVLPKRTHDVGPVDEPHAGSTYSRIASILKVLYLFADIELDWLLRLRRELRSGQWLVVERGWWDIAVDPRRYRLSAGSRVALLLGRLVPAPALVVLLEAEPAVIHRRKAELPHDEIARQVEAWRATVPRRSAVLRVDTGEVTPEQIARTAVDTLQCAAHVLPGRGVALPPVPAPRWVLPREPRRAAVAGLRVYRPLTRRARLGWSALHVAAWLGAFRLAPSAEVNTDVAVRLQPFLGPGERLAVARSRHVGRHTALVIAADGRPRLLAKLASSPEGRAALERETRALEEWGVRADGAVAAPVVRGTGAGILVTEYVEPTSGAERRLREGLAYEVGRLSRELGSDGRWFAHGDFAPWNVLRTGSGWCLVDWEEARADAEPFHDLVHYLVQSCVLLGYPSRADLLAGFRGDGDVGAAVAAYARGAGLAAADAADALETHLVASLARGVGGVGAAEDDRRGFRGKRALLSTLRGTA